MQHASLAIAFFAMMSRGVFGLATAVVLAIPSLAEPIVAAQGLGPTAFTAPGRFPVSLFQHYFNSPTATTAQPQPVITDPITVRKLQSRQIHTERVIYSTRHIRCR